MKFHSFLPVLSTILILAGCTGVKVAQPGVTQDDQTSLAFRQLTKSSHWQLTKVVDIDFKAFHTQGMLKIGDIFYVSAVEIIDKSETYGKTDSLWDFSLTRTPGRGRGWLFKFNEKGNLLAKTELTKGDAFHPGGIDFDGSYIWVSVAQYRPNSHTNIYRIDPNTMEAQLSFQVKDHIGNIIHNPDRDTFHGTSWGGRRMYQWHVRLNQNGEGEITQQSWQPNPSHYVDYQDCQYQGVNYMLCSGLQKYTTSIGKFALGGIDLIDISDSKPVPVHLVPVVQYWHGNKDMTVANFEPDDMEMVVSNNPFWAEAITDRTATADGVKVMRFYFMPDRGAISQLLIYEVAVPFLSKQK